MRLIQNVHQEPVDRVCRFVDSAKKYHDCSQQKLVCANLLTGYLVTKSNLVAELFEIVL